MSFYGSVYYQLIDTFYKMIVKNSGDKTFDEFQGNNIIYPSGTPDNEIIGSPAIGRKGIFSLDSGNYWINFSKEEVYNEKDNEDEKIAAPYKIWHSEPHNDEKTRVRVSGWDVEKYTSKVDDVGNETGVFDENEYQLVEGEDKDYIQLQDEEFLKIHPTYYDEAGHVIGKATEHKLYRLPKLKKLFNKVTMKNADIDASNFNDIQGSFTQEALSPVTELSFEAGNNWIHFSKDENNNNKVPYKIWHSAPRMNSDEASPLVWNYDPSEFDIIKEQQYDEGGKYLGEIITKITDKTRDKVIYEKVGNEEKIDGYIQLDNQDFIRIYSPRHDKAGHSYQGVETTLYRLPKSGAEEMKSLIGSPVKSMPRWFDDITLNEQATVDNSISNLYQYAEKNFDNITDMRDKLGLIDKSTSQNTEDRWYDSDLIDVIGSKENLAELKIELEDVKGFENTFNLSNAIAFNNNLIDAVTTHSRNVRADLGDPSSVDSPSAFDEIYDLKENLAKEIERSVKADEENATAISNEIERATNAEEVLTDNLNNEITRATNAENTNASNITSLTNLIGEADPEGPFTDSTVFRAIENNTVNINTISAQIGSTDQAGTIIARVSTNEGDISNVKSDISTINNSIRTLDGLANDNAGDIITINNTIGDGANLPEGETVVSIINNLLERVGVLESEIATLKGEAQ